MLPIETGVPPGYPRSLTFADRGAEITAILQADECLRLPGSWWYEGLSALPIRVGIGLSVQMMQ